jgi:pimeloyl-ACP methyl ester carboxylesterase
MTAVQHRMIETNGIRMHVAEQGEGPAVLLCHGFPESWYSWRHQLQALAEAGFRAIAPDMRGYGQTDAPAEIDRYSMFHLVGDMVGLLDALGLERAAIVGHDWGAPVAWHAALLCPDRFRGVAGLSVPFRPRLAGGGPPTARMPRRDDAVFYQLYFQDPGVAEADLGRDVRRSLLTLFGLQFQRGAQGGEVGMVPLDRGMIGSAPAQPGLPPWLGEDDVAFYTAEFQRTGFRGPLNWYRNIDRNWELLAPFAGAKISCPALYVAGDQDLVVHFPGMDQLIANLSQWIPRLTRTVMLPGCGHWTQQERAPEVNAALIAFLRGLEA